MSDLDRRVAPVLARFIEHTALGPSVTLDRVRALCREAVEANCLAVCVAGSFVQAAIDALDGAGPRCVTVVGFPHGDAHLSVKSHEAKIAVISGADEIDMVMAIGKFKSERYGDVEDDIRAVVEGAGEAAGVPVKVILETALLDDDDKRRACELAEKAGAAFVKTSTGFADGGATAADVALLRQCVGDRLGVKASGGIRTAEAALAMIEAGASRLGCSATLRILASLG